MGLARRAGTGVLPGGHRLTWSVADGRRGRRWRAVTTSGDRLLHALHLETDSDGRLAKLELAGPDGLLTLHPEPDQGLLHGNVVKADGISHVTLPWSDRHLLVVGSSPITAAVAAAGLATGIGVGEGTGRPAVEIDPTLGIRAATWRIARLGERRWRLLAADGGASIALELDADGIPELGGGATSWPLEQSAKA